MTLLYLIEVDRASKRSHTQSNMSKPSIDSITTTARRDIVTTNTGEGVTMEPWREKVDRASTRDHTESTLSKAGMYVTTHSNQEREEHIMTGHMAEPITKDQPSRETIVTTYAGEDVFEGMKEYIVTKHNAERSEKDRPSRENVFINRVLLKTTVVTAHNPRSFATLDRLGGWGDTQV